MCFKEISCRFDDLLAEHFKTDKTSELVARKYFWPNFYKDVKAYIKDCNIYLTLMIVYQSYIEIFSTNIYLSLE